MPNQFIKKKIPLRNITVELNDVKRIYKKLHKYVQEEGELLTKEMKRLPDQSDEEYDQRVESARSNAFRIYVTISGRDGQDIVEDSVDIFDSENLPDEIESIFMSNIAAYRGYTRQDPSNSFDVTFDFSCPALIDNTNPISNPTRNASLVSIDGDRDSWVASIQEAVTGVLNSKKNGRSFLHKAFVYDALLWFFVFPAAVYACWRFSDLVDLVVGSSMFLSSVVYVYIILLFFILYRILFGYAKWAFPTVELSDGTRKTERHRRWLYAILTGITAGIIVEFVIFIFLRSAERTVHYTQRVIQKIGVERGSPFSAVRTGHSLSFTKRCMDFIIDPLYMSGNRFFHAKRGNINGRCETCKTDDFGVWTGWIYCRDLCGPRHGGAGAYSGHAAGGAVDHHHRS